MTATIDAEHAAYVRNRLGRDMPVNLEVCTTVHGDCALYVGHHRVHGDEAVADALEAIAAIVREGVGQ